ncbi:hypothetical protein ACS0PU_006775 [Formica fusca]
MANMKHIILLSCIMLLLLPRDSVGAKGKVAVDTKGKVAVGAKDKAVKDSQDNDSFSLSSSASAERSSENKGDRNERAIKENFLI